MFEFGEKWHRAFGPQPCIGIVGVEEDPRKASSGRGALRVFRVCFMESFMMRWVGVVFFPFALWQGWPFHSCLAFVYSLQLMFEPARPRLWPCFGIERPS